MYKTFFGENYKTSLRHYRHAKWRDLTIFADNMPHGSKRADSTQNDSQSECETNHSPNEIFVESDKVM